MEFNDMREMFELVVCKTWVRRFFLYIKACSLMLGVT